MKEREREREWQRERERGERERVEIKIKIKIVIKIEIKKLNIGNLVRVNIIYGFLILRIFNTDNLRDSYIIQFIKK